MNDTFALVRTICCGSLNLRGEFIRISKNLHFTCFDCGAIFSFDGKIFTDSHPVVLKTGKTAHRLF